MGGLISENELFQATFGEKKLAIWSNRAIKNFYDKEILFVQ